MSLLSCCVLQCHWLACARSNEAEPNGCATSVVCQPTGPDPYCCQLENCRDDPDHTDPVGPAQARSLSTTHRHIPICPPFHDSTGTCKQSINNTKNSQQSAQSPIHHTSALRHGLEQWSRSIATAIAIFSTRRVTSSRTVTPSMLKLSMPNCLLSRPLDSTPRCAVVTSDSRPWLDVRSP